MFGLGKKKQPTQTASYTIGGVAMTVQASFGKGMWPKHELVFEAAKSPNPDINRHIVGLIIRNLQSKGIDFDGCDLKNPLHIVVPSSSPGLNFAILDGVCKQLAEQVKDQERLKALIQLNILREKHKDNPIQLPEGLADMIKPKG